MTLHTWHRFSAFVLIAYVLLHLSNHVMAVAGPAAHVAFMDALRPLYRNVVVEPLLLLCVLFQAGSGLWMVLKGWRGRRGAVAWLQAGSGMYLAFFMLFHVAAVLFGRAVLKLDTNFWYAAAGFTVRPYQLFFIPYYFLAICALFAHLGCALHWQARKCGPKARMAALALPALSGALLALVVTLAFDGWLYRLDVPAQYLTIYK